MIDAAATTLKGENDTIVYFYDYTNVYKIKIYARDVSLSFNELLKFPLPSTTPLLHHYRH